MEYGKEGEVKERKNEDKGGRDRDILDVREEGGKERVVVGERRERARKRENGKSDETRP